LALHACSDWLQVLGVWLVVAAEITYDSTLQMTSVIVATPRNLADRLTATGKHLPIHSRKMIAANNGVVYSSGVQ